jgi:AraC-like DNA-binding protein
MNEQATQSEPSGCDLGKCETVPVDYFNSGEHSQADAFALWHQFASGINDIVVSDEEFERLHMQTMAARVDHVVVSWFEASCHRFVRSGHHIENGFSDYVRLRLYRKGRSQAIYENTPFELGPGAVHLIDYSRPVFEQIHGVEQIGLYLPHWAIGYDPSIHPQYLQFGLDTPAGRIIADTIQTLVSKAPHLHDDAAPGLAAGVSGLLRGLLHGPKNEPERRAIQVARSRAFRTHIEQNLRDPDLGVAGLSKVFGAARATIYRDFADDGGVERYIVARCLERAYLSLADAEQKRGAVQAASDEWGFSSVGRFSRLFRERFNCTPGEVVGMRTSHDTGMASHQDCGMDCALKASGNERAGTLIGSWLSAL